MSVRVAIIGAGPAGLASAGALEANGCESFVFDAGLPATRRHHRTSRDLGIGVGGAGLFSDGKFSYFPSATRLYALRSRDALIEAYERAIDVLDSCRIAVEPFPDDDIDFTRDATDRTGRKHYACHYATLSQRRSLIRRLAQGRQIRTRAMVAAAEKRTEGYVLVTTDDVSHGPFDALIVATGRTGLAGANVDLLPASAVLPGGRVEVGVRIEAPADASFFAEAGADIKFIWESSNGAEVRTFCTCRNGEVWLIDYPSFSALSGRSDCPRTGYSNFGLLLRSPSHWHDSAMANVAEIVNMTNGEAFWDSLPNVLAGRDVTRGIAFRGDRPWYPADRMRRRPFVELLEGTLRSAFLEALDRLVTHWPDFLSGDTACIFPSIEGFGRYPALDGDLKVTGEHIWFAGDAVGRFRGIVAALVSGYYVGILASQALNDRIN